MQRKPVIDGQAHRYRLVGDVVSVDASAVEDLINAGRIPVVSSVAPNEDDATEVLNVNADSAAAALAAAPWSQQAGRVDRRRRSVCRLAGP